MSERLICETCGFMKDSPKHELGCPDGGIVVVRRVVREMLKEILQEEIDKEVFRGR